ncbi:MAG: ACP phosphodiesterase [Akkermansiaceae bacterium]
MNFLAHFHLAKPTDGSRVGALLGDFVRGTPESLRRKLTNDLVEGIMLHRAIDQFTDSHPVFQECKTLLHPSRRRFAGIVIDLFFDHLLSINWAHFSSTPLPSFIAEIHRTLERKAYWLPPEVTPVVERMMKQEWLGSYQSRRGLIQTLQRVSQRRSFLKPLREAEEDFSAHREAFQDAFNRFYPELVSFVDQISEGGAFSSP